MPLKATQLNSPPAATEEEDEFTVVRRYPRTLRMRRKLWIVTFCREIPALRQLCFWAQGRGVIAHPALYAQVNDMALEEDDHISLSKSLNKKDALCAFTEMLNETETSSHCEKRDVYKMQVDRTIPAGTTLLSIPIDRDGDEFRKKDYLSGRVAFAPEGDDHGRMPTFFGDEPEVIKRRTCVMRTRMSRNSRSTAHLMVSTDGKSIRGGDSVNNVMNDPSFYHLVEKAARGLYSDGYPFKPYLEFLHDLHNSSTEMEEGANKDEDDDSHPHQSSQHQKARKDDYTPVDVFDIRQDEYDDVTLGNELNIKGVENAPFLTLSDVQTARGKASLVWAKRSSHQMALGLPHFCSGAVAWAQSMVLSRALVIDSVPPTDSNLPKPLLLPCVPGIAADDVEKHCQDDENYKPQGPTVLPQCARSDQEMALVPLLDFCGHSSNPTAHYCISVPSNNGLNYGQLHKHDNRPPAVGVKGWKKDRANIHLITLKDLHKGDEITIKYMDDHGGGGGAVGQHHQKQQPSSHRRRGSLSSGSDSQDYDAVADIWKVRYGIEKKGGRREPHHSFYSLSNKLVEAVTTRQKRQK